MDATTPQQDFFARLRAPEVLEDDDQHYEPHLRPRVPHPGIPARRLDDLWRRWWRLDESAEIIATEMRLRLPDVVALIGQWRRGLDQDLTRHMQAKEAADRAAGPAAERPTQHERESLQGLDPAAVYRTWRQLMDEDDEGVTEILCERYGVQPRTLAAILARAGRPKAFRPGNQTRLRKA
ncbi:MAG: hypothetical protein DI601_00315 [Azospirillum brasilense]|nr:MAG: hypothetical protein DI601_00315 [Azospirillum brasilense]